MKTYKEKETKQLELLKQHLPVISKKGKGHIVGGGELEDLEDEF